MNERRATPFRTRARTRVLACTPIVVVGVLAAIAGCNSVRTTSPNPGTTMPGKQNMYVVVTNGRWDLVGFVPTLTGVSAAGSGFQVTPSASVLHNRAVTTGRANGADSLTPTFVIVGPPTGTDLKTPTYEAFDKAGNAWVSVHGTGFNGSVIEYTPADQKTGDSIPPSVGIGGLQYPEGLTFDGPGNLWVLDGQTDRLSGYTPDQLKTAGSPFPAHTVSLAALNIGGATYSPLVVALDPQGDFWISANIQSRPASDAGDSLPAFVVAKFTSAQIAAGGAPVPVITISMQGVFPGGYGPGIAFDSAGNLWTANADSATLTKFVAASLTDGSHPAPVVRIGHLLFGEPFLNGISDVGIDPSGILFVATGYARVPGASIFGFLPSQLQTDGSPSPVIAFLPGAGVTHMAVRP
ncbi:MAG: hypothetical protein ACHQTF_03865 [Gemmatimonadales bacterium]